MTKTIHYTITCPDEPPVLPRGWTLLRYTVSQECANQVNFKPSELSRARTLWVEFGYERLNLCALGYFETEEGELILETEWEESKGAWSSWYDFYFGREISDLEAWLKERGGWVNE